MALKAGYYGIKKKMVKKLINLTGIYSLGQGLTLSSAGALSCKNATTSQKGIVQLDASPTDNSSNPVTSDGVYNGIESAYQLVEDTIGWSGKNKLDTSEILYLYIDTANSKYATQGTPNVCVAKVEPNTKYIITKQTGTHFRVAISQDYPANNVAYSNTIANHTGTTIEITTGANDHYIGVYTDVSDFPTAMVRDADILDPTYEPYHASVDESKYNRSEANVLGAKNLFNGSATTTTDSYGLTWKVDSDDNNIITVSGTPTGFQAFSMYSDSVLPVGAYILSGWGETTNVAVNIVRLCLNGSTVKTYEGTEANSLTITIDDTVYDEVVIELKRKVNNVACSGTAKIMIRLASDTDNTYVPYAETNYQLTNSKANASALGTVENGAKASKAYAVGEHFSRFGNFCTVTQPIASGGTLTEGTNYSVGSIGDELSKNPISTTITATSSKISISSSYNKVYKVGNVVSFKIRITVNTAITNDADETLFSVPYTPVLTNQVFQVISANAPWTDAGFGAYLTTSKNIIVKANISTGSYDIHGIYVTTD